MGDIFYLNKKIINAYNSLKVTEFSSLVDEILTNRTEKQIEKIFSSKFYVWNFIRSKDFYKLMALYVSSRIKNIGIDSKTILVIDTILKTSNNDITRRQFCQAMNNKAVILTHSTIRYIGIDALDNILSKEDNNNIITDEIVGVFIKHYIRLDRMLDTITDL